jgi:hypothetical protein
MSVVASRKQVAFHQAEIVVVFRVTDGRRSFGLHPVKLAVLLDTDDEWDAMRAQLRGQMEKMQQALDNVAIEDGG